MTASKPRPASIWSRFWSPSSLLEPVPSSASDEEAEAIRRRNDVWLKTYMDMYIVRWGALWAASVAGAVLLMDAPGFLFFLVLALNLAALAGLIAMIMTYRRASKAVQDQAANKGPR